jgi:uncharacterized protein YqhQ
MIRGQRHVSVAVRRPNGSIALQCRELGGFFTGRLRRVPLVRGVIVLIETLTLGMRALSYSANVGLEEEGQEIGKGAVAVMIGVSLVLAIGLFFMVPVLASRSLEAPLGSDLLSNIAEGVIRLVLFVGYLVLIGRMKDIRRVFMYHGAEHMTVHAQEHGDPLNVEAVRKYSTAHPRCGTAFLLVVMVVAIVVFVFVGRDPFWWLVSSRVVLIPFIAAAGYEVIRFSGRHARNPLLGVEAVRKYPTAHPRRGTALLLVVMVVAIVVFIFVGRDPFWWLISSRMVLIPFIAATSYFITGASLALQALTTQQPDDDQIEVAIAAMEQAIEADEGQLARSDGDA